MAAETSVAVDSSFDKGPTGRRKNATAHKYSNYFKKGFASKLRQSGDAVQSLFVSEDSGTSTSGDARTQQADTSVTDDSSGYLRLMELVDNIHQEEGEEEVSIRGEMLLGKLREFHQKKLLRSRVICMNDRFDIEDDDDDNDDYMYDQSADVMSSDSDDNEDGYESDSYLDKDDDDGDDVVTNITNNTVTTGQHLPPVTAHSLDKRKFLNRSLSTKKTTNKKGVLDMTVEGLSASDLGLDIGLDTEHGRTLLKKTFWLVKSMRVDHFGKRLRDKLWLDEMKRVLEEETCVLTEVRIESRSSSVMWRLRDGFERFEEQCYSTGQWNDQPQTITRRCFNLYFGHLFTMSNKKDWSVQLHEDYLELMIHTLMKTREIILAETLSNELWTELEGRGVVSAEGIARLG